MSNSMKGYLDPLILAVLSGGPLHGYAVIEELKAQSGGELDLPEGTVYPALHRLEQAGLLASSWTTPSGGRKRRVYSLTKGGTSALAERRKAWGRFSQAVDTLLKGGRAWPA